MKSNLVLLALSIVFFLNFSCTNENTGSRATADSLNEVKSELPATKDNKLAVTVPEAEFATRTAAAGIAKLELSKLAAQKTTNPQIKQFAEDVAKDLSSSNAQLSEIAKQKAITLPEGLDDIHQKMWDDLKGKTDKAFDQAYLNAMATGQDQTNELIKKALTTMSDVDLKKFAQNFLQTSQLHAKALQAINTY